VNPKTPRKLLVEAVVSALSMSPKALRRRSLRAVVGRDRYGLFFTEAIGDRISLDASRTPLFYGEVKIDANNRYHAIPRTRPSEG